jgi:hypothetical protein
MRNVLIIALACLLLGSAAAAQEQDPKMAVLKEFTRSVQTDGVMLSFVLLNDRTVDALFQAPGKYSMRARARMGTTFFVQGIAEKDIKIDTAFAVEQDGQTTAGTSSNIKNFAGGGLVAKGDRIDGIVEVGKKLDVSHSFKIKGKNSTVEFKLSPEAIKLMEPLPPAAPAAAPED